MSDLLSLVNAVRRQPRERTPVRMLADEYYAQGGMTFFHACRLAATARRACLTTAELTQAARCIRPGATYRAEIFRAVELYLTGQATGSIRLYVVPGSRPPELTLRKSTPAHFVRSLPDVRVGARWIIAENKRHRTTARKQRTIYRWLRKNP